MTADMIHAGLGWPVAGSLGRAQLHAVFHHRGLGHRGRGGDAGGAGGSAARRRDHPGAWAGAAGFECGALSIMRLMSTALVVPAFVLGALIGVRSAAHGRAAARRCDPDRGRAASSCGRCSSPTGLLAQFGLITGTISSFLTMFFGGTGPFVADLRQGSGLRPADPCRHSRCVDDASAPAQDTGFRPARLRLLAMAGLCGAADRRGGLLGTLSVGGSLLRIDERRFALTLPC